MRNVELKCELRDFTLAQKICRQVGAQHEASLEQRDTYYRVDRGRLKRREVAGALTEWIEYYRSDRATPRPSDYTVFGPAQLSERHDPKMLEPWVTVDKRRELYLKGRVRIHLDRVAELGPYLEFEALVDEAQSERQAEAALQELLAAFKPALGSIQPQSYSDLLGAQRPRD